MSAGWNDHAGCCDLCDGTPSAGTEGACWQCHGTGHAHAPDLTPEGYALALSMWAGGMDEYLTANPGHDLSAEDVVGNALMRVAALRREIEAPT